MQRLKLARYDPVIYCYELQLHPSVHRKGLGKRIMQMLELVVSRPYMCRCIAATQQRLARLWLQGVCTTRAPRPT